jgi:hypothetical protein
VSDSALIKVLGAIAYGEQKAHDKATQRAAAAGDDRDRRMWRTIAAEELRHHRGFVRRLAALGADPEHAMAPFRPALDRFHDRPPDPDAVRAAVADFLGEGIATDLLLWLRRVVDEETASFVDTVLADEAGHEARAADELRRLVGASPWGAWRALDGARAMLLRMAGSGAGGVLPLTAFWRVGRGPELVAALSAGFVRRLHRVGVGPLALLPRPDRLWQVVG